MNIIDILKGIENLAVELLLWIIYIPKTIFKIIKDPFWVSGYIDSELKKDERFTNYMSPILLYLGTSVILFVILGMVEASFAESSNKKSFLDEVQGLEGLLFLILPLLLALIIELFRKGKFNRLSVLRGLFIQCYYFSPLMLALFAFNISEVFYWSSTDISIAAHIPAVLLFLTFIWFLIIEIKFISKDLSVNKFKSFGIFTAWFLLLFVSFIYYSIISDTDINNYSKNEADNEFGYIMEPETYQFKITETGEYVIKVDDVDDLYIYEDNYSITLEKIPNNKAIEKFDRPNASISNHINLIHDQVYGGLINNNYPHVFRGIEGDIVKINLYILEGAFNENSVLTLSKGIPTGESKIEVIASSIFFDESTPEDGYAEFLLPSTGQFSFNLGSITDINWGSGSYGLYISIHEDVYDYLPEIRYNEKYEGTFSSNGGNWKFYGTEGDELKFTINSQDADIKFNIFKDGKSIIPIQNESFLPVIRWIYIMFFGYAVLIGWRAFFRKRKIEDVQIETTNT